MTISNKVTLFITIACVIIANVIHKYATDYTLYFAIPAICFLIYLNLQKGKTA